MLRLFFALLTLACVSTAHAAPGDKTVIGPGFAFSNLSGAGGKIRAGKPGDTFRVTGSGTTTVTANPATKTLTISGDGVSSFNGRAGAVTPQPGDYTTTQVTEGTNLYHTTARASAAAPVQSVNGMTGAVVVVSGLTLGTANGLSLAGQVLSLQAATNSVPGALTAADHTTFAGKLDPTGSASSLTGFPTLNQNTTGSADKLTTARTINGVSFDGSANIQTSTASTSDCTPWTAWTPTAVGLTVVGTPAYTARYAKIGKVVFCWIGLVASTSTASTYPTTTLTLPVAPAYTVPTSNAVTAGGYTYGVGFAYPDSKVYLPTWSATGSEVFINFYYEVP